MTTNSESGITQTNPGNTPSNDEAQFIGVKVLRLDQLVYTDLAGHIFHVQALTSIEESIELVGQRTPILATPIDGKYLVLDGHHRTQAIANLGKPTVAAVIVTCPPDEQEYYEIVECLHRKSISALQRAELENKWRLIVASQVGQSAPPGGHQPAEKGMRKAAARIGTTRESLRRSEKIASLSDSVKKRVRELGLEDNQSALLTIAAKVSPTEQLETTENLAASKARASKACISDDAMGIDMDDSRVLILRSPVDEVHHKMENLWHMWCESDFKKIYSKEKISVQRKFLKRLADCIGMPTPFE